MKFDNIKVISENNEIIEAKSRVEYSGDGNTAKIWITPSSTVKIKEVVIFDGQADWKSTDRYYGDGYTMLSQYGGTVSNPYCLTGLSDKNHYKMPQTIGYHTSYNYVYAGNDIDGYSLYGASSCRRFRAEFRHHENSLIIAQSLENLLYEKGVEIELEEMIFFKSDKISDALDFLASMTEKNHPMKKYSELPTGWCSWYCCGPDVTEKDIFNALDEIKKRIPELKFIQIDDGFQPHMGDWLMTGSKFGRPIGDICRDIKKAGFEPAIWLAPFIASEKSDLFISHPDWFVKGENGLPLCSADVTFQGWRDAPWYFLDATHPDALKYIYDVCKTIREEWGVKYYKLDANVWGALPFGVRYDKNATAAQAYRKGMETLWEAVGEDSYVLGCNAPMWASLGTVSGMRVTGDIGRSRGSVKACAIEGFSRNWMNGRLWINDPDCIVMADTNPNVMDSAGVVMRNSADDDMFEYNNIYIKASGGAVLSGDFIDKLSDKDISFLKKIISKQGKAAVFNSDLTVGTIDNKDSIDYFVFNHGENPADVEIDVISNELINQYTDEKTHISDKKLKLKLNPISAKWFTAIKN